MLVNNNERFSNGNRWESSMQRSSTRKIGEKLIMMMLFWSLSRMQPEFGLVVVGNGTSLTPTTVRPHMS